jgi:hypothetical protein
LSDDAAERAIEALIDAEPMMVGDSLLHADALRRTIDDSGLPLASRLGLHRLLDRKGAERRQSN